MSRVPAWSQSYSWSFCCFKSICFFQLKQDVSSVALLRSYFLLSTTCSIHGILRENFHKPGESFQPDVEVAGSPQTVNLEIPGSFSGRPPKRNVLPKNHRVDLGREVNTKLRWTYYFLLCNFLLLLTSPLPGKLQNPKHLVPILADPFPKERKDIWLFLKVISSFSFWDFCCVSLQCSVCNIHEYRVFITIPFLKL